MSVVSNIHTATVYDPKKSKAFDGQRLVISIARADKNGNYGEHLQQTMCTSIPVLQDEELIEALNDDALQPKLVPHIMAWLHDTQRELITAQLKEGRKEVTTEQISIPSLLSFLSEVRTGDKWDADRIAAWFTDTLAEHIGVALITKGFSDEDTEKRLASYGMLFAKTFSSKASIPLKVAKELQKALALYDNQDDAVVSKFMARVTKVVEESKIEESLGL